MQLKSIIILVIAVVNLSITATDIKPASQAASYFSEIKQSTEIIKNLWGRELYGPMLLVDAKTRTVIANYPDSDGVLVKSGDLYKGLLPKELNIANTSITWSGRNWAMIMLPLSEDRFSRINLMAHELYHRIQPELGFTSHNPANNHLDEEQGRILLRLELEALKQAVVVKDSAQRLVHLTAALTFRKSRHEKYQAAATSENLLELNEGLAEYTGLVISARQPDQTLQQLVSNIDRFFKNPSFVRSFAYVTTPVYGYLLADEQQKWNLDIKDDTDLTNYFLKAFNIKLPEQLAKASSDISNNYNGKVITAEEIQRAEKIKIVKARHMKKFVSEPHLVLKFENMNISFDPGKIFPLDDLGTVYPTIRVTDNWGILEVEKGALMSPVWSEITVSKPLEFNANKISGEGWKLELKTGYQVIKNEHNDNFQISKL